MKGVVTINGTKRDCAIKMLRVAGRTSLNLPLIQSGASEDDKDSLLAEAALMSSFCHPNVVACYGQVCLRPPVFTQ